MRGASLKSMSVEALIETRKQIDNLLAAKVKTAKRELEDRLSYLDSLFGKGRRGAPKARRAVAAKYRGPNGETWAGRGMRPRWLTALVNSGHNIEEFAVDGVNSTRQSSAAKRTKGRRKGAGRKAKARAA